MSNQFLRRGLVALVLAVVAVPALAAPAETRRWYVRAHYTDPAALRALTARSTHLNIDRAHQVVALDVDAQGLATLNELGFTVQIDLVSSARLQAVTDALDTGKQLASIPGFSCYRTVEETYATMDSLVTARPDLASVVEIGNSWERQHNAANGYRLRVLKLTNHATDAAETKPKMFVMYGIHAREYTTAELGTRLAEWLVDNYGKDPQATWLLDHNEFHFLLQSNPDGRKRAESGLSWRKNTDTINGNCPSNANVSGIDLNRNYPFHWNTEINGSSGNTCDETFRGPTAGSEPETQAVVSYVTSIFPDRRPDDATVAAPDDYQGLFFDIHSYSQLVLWPWGFDTPAPNMAALAALGKRLAWYNGYTPEQSKDLYPTDGTTDDTFYGLLGVPAYTIELGIAFFEDCATFEAHTYPQNSAALLYAARTLHAPYHLPAGPDAYAVTAAPDLIAVGSPIQVRATVDDSRFNQSNGAESVQAITAARATLDVPPWGPAAVPLSLIAADGNFDTSREDVTGALDSTGLAPGRHLLYVQGEDASGAQGAPSAAFVDIAAASDVSTLQGRVRDALDNHPLPGADVRIHDAAQDYRSTSTADGSFVRTAHPGTVAIDVSAPGYLPLGRTGVTLLPGTTRLQDYALFPKCATFDDDIEGATTAWTAQAPWGVATNVGGNATHVWTDSPAGNYTNGRNVSLTTRSFNFATAADVEVTFDHKCKTEAGFDYGHVEISTDATHTTWTEVYRCSGQAQWETRTVALPQAAGKSDVKLRFRFTSDGGVVDEGWSIDNVHVRAGGAACAAQYASDEIFPDDFEG